MRVGVIGPLGPDLFADNIMKCLPDLQVEPIALGNPRITTRSIKVNHLNELISTAVTTWDLRQQQVVARRAIDARCDVVINVNSGLMPQTVDTFRQAGINIAMWFPDHMANLGRQLMLASAYSRIYLTDPEAVSRLSHQTSLPVAYLPEACNPAVHQPVEDAQFNPRLVVAGNMYPSRVLVLDRLHEDGIPLDLYGDGFPRWLPKRPVMDRHTGRYVSGERKARVFREAAGVLNNLHPVEGGVNCRLFEATASGAAVLCEHRDAIVDLFEPDGEVVTYNSYDELVLKARRLINEPEWSRQIGDAAAIRAKAQHTYQQRLSIILADLN